MPATGASKNKFMKKKINYTEEPKDGLELPESGFEVLSGSSVSKKWKELTVLEKDYEKREKGSTLQLLPKRGGAREGAGRRRTGHVRLQLSVSAVTRKKIESIAKLKKISLSQAVEQLAADV